MYRRRRNYRNYGRQNYYGQRGGLFGRRGGYDGYGRRGGLFGRRDGYDGYGGYRRRGGLLSRRDGYDSYGYGRRGGLFSRHNDYGRGYASGSSNYSESDSTEIKTVTSTVLGWLTKIGQKGKSVLKKNPPIKVNVFAYDNCAIEGEYLELKCKIDGADYETI